MVDSVTVKAPGKINLILRVGAPGPDGYHDLVTCFHAVDISETITVAHADEFSLSVAGSVSLDEIPLGGDNLAIRAAKALAALSGYQGGAKITIDKQVPVGGGMGGGSADAAGALVALNELWETGHDIAELLAVAAPLGADVPFALLGGSAVGRGRGDQLTSVPSGVFNWVLVPSAVHLSTPQVYATLDVLRGDEAVVAPREPSEEFFAAMASGDATALSPLLVNDLAPASLELHPDLARTLSQGKGLGALAGMVSGSGPTLVFLAADAQGAEHLALGLEAGGHRALRVTSPVQGAHLVESR